MSSPLRTPLTVSRPLREAGHRVDVPIAIFVYLGGWIGAQLVVAVVLGIGGYSGVDETPIWILFVAQLFAWSAYGVALVVASEKGGSGHFVEDYRVRFKPVDVLGIPAGVLTQLVVLPLIYLPLERIWERTFNDDKLSENARDLVDRAAGGSMVLLVIMVCVGAPIVEELVYRGLLQGSFAARFNQVPAWLVASAIFAVIHFRPVEYPGLLAIGLVCGFCAMSTGRLGMAMACHVGFNVTGLLLALD